MTGRPHVTVSWGASACGRASARDGTSRWINCMEAREDVHRQRARADAVVVGASTVLADDPHLTVRHPDGTLADRQPLRVVLDRSGLIQLPGQFRVFDNAAETLVLANPDITGALAALAALGVRDAFIEGGPRILGAALAAGVADRVLVYWAPVVLGEGLAAVGPAGVSTITEAHRLRLTDVTQFGSDLRLTLLPSP